MLHWFISKKKAKYIRKEYVNVFLRNDTPQKREQHTVGIHFYTASIIQEHLIYSVLTTMYGTPKKYSPQTHEHERKIFITNKHKHTWLTVYYTVLYYIAPTSFNANGSSSGSAHSVPAKLHKRVHAVLVYTPGRSSDNISTQTVCTATWEIS